MKAMKQNYSIFWDHLQTNWEINYAFKLNIEMVFVNYSDLNKKISNQCFILKTFPIPGAIIHWPILIHFLLLFATF